MNEELYSDATIQMPEQASTLAPIVDSLYYDIFWISVVFFVAIVGCMAFFAWRFRRRPGVRSKPPGHHTALELFWTFSPLILLAYMFHQGFDGFMEMSIVPENAISIRAQARRYSWQYEQPNGMVDSTLRVPMNRPVRVIMSSVPNTSAPQDGAVLHSFFVPDFRIKRDVVPGMYTSLWFEAVGRGVTDGHPRRHQVYCAEYCGVGHSQMLSSVEVMTQRDYDSYLGGGPECPDQYEEDWQWGEALFTENACMSCHFVDASAGVLVGPNLANVAGTMQPLEGGGEVMADLEYLHESITDPSAAVVDGFGNRAMPPYNLPARPMSALVQYVAHLSSEGGDLVQSQHCGAAAEGGEE